METYIAYYRVSTSSERQSLSFDFQRESVNKFLEIYGGTVIKEFKEEISGSTNNRKLFNQAVDLCARNGYILLVHKLSRLSRGGLSTIAYLEQQGVKYIEAVSPKDSSFVKGIKLLQAREENLERKDAIKRGMAQIKRNIAANGFHVSKSGNRITSLGAPENLTDQARRKAVESNRRKALNNNNNLKAKALIELLIPNELSLKAMADYLNQKGFKTSTGKEFMAMSVSNLIKLYGLDRKKQLA